ncbi:MAG: retropepsin-like aspartic protease [Candidatus Zixiibacteriota bacterium]
MLKKTLPVLLQLFVVTSSSAFNLDSLLIVSIGGQEAYDTLKQMTSYRAEGSVNLNGQQGRFEEYFVTPNKFYLEAHFEGFSIAQAYDGRIAWQKDHNGRISVLEGLEKRELLKNLYFESFAYLFPGRLPGELEYRGQTVKDGEIYHEVAFYPLMTDTVLVYYDIQSGLRKLMLSRLDNLSTITHVGKYQEVSGILVPFYSKATCEGVSLFSEFELETVAINVPIDTSIFSIPSTGLADYHFPAEVPYVVVPFQYLAGHIILSATINGKKRVRLILDSGSSANILHKPVLEQLGLPVVGTLPARGIDGFEQVDLVKIDSISIGQLTLYDQIAGSLDLSQLKRADTKYEDFGGLLGYDFLSRFPVLIDFQNSILTVYNPQGFKPPSGGVEVGFYLTMLVPTVRGELIGIPGDFIVDLGNPFGLIVHWKFAKINDLEKKLDDVRDIDSFSGIGGGLSSKTAYAATFQIGDILIQSLQVILPDSSAGLAGSDQLAGNIGNLILENFNVLLDYKNSRLIFYVSDT